jgi:multidrug resistance protein, MATE family
MSRAAPLRVLILLALPMVLSRATQSIMTFADALLVKHLGTDAIVASATGGFNVFLFAMLPMGTVFIVQSFVAQLAGRGDADDAPRFAWYGLGIAAVAGAAAAALIPAIGPLLEHTHYSPAVREQMSEYMAIRMYSVAAIVAIEALGNWYGGLGNTWMALVASVISLAVDLILSWVLIFGHLGAPALGVNGAALANTIGSWAGFLFLAVAFYRRWGDAPRGRSRLGLSLGELYRVVRFGLPNGMNWFLEFAAFQLVFVNLVLSDLGDDIVAALNVVIAINSLSFMPAFGLASAGAILAGQAIGRGDRDAVWPQVKVTLLCTMTWMGAIGVFYLVIPGRLMNLFNEDGRSITLASTGATMLAISAAWQLFDAIAISLSETLRSAGDTFWTAAARFVLAWSVFLPAAFFVVRELGGGALGAMACLVGYLALLSAMFAFRFRSGAWRRIQLIEPKLV